MLDKIEGLYRDLTYYLFDAGLWKWMLLSLCFFQLGKCSFQVKESYVPPDCENHKINYDAITNKITYEVLCENSPKTEESLCRLLHSGSSQKKLNQKVFHETAETAEDQAQSITGIYKLPEKDLWDSLMTAPIVKVAD